MPPTVLHVLVGEVPSNSGLFRLLGIVYLAVADQVTYSSLYIYIYIYIYIWICWRGCWCYGAWCDAPSWCCAPPCHSSLVQMFQMDMLMVLFVSSVNQVACLYSVELTSLTGDIICSPWPQSWAILDQPKGTTYYPQQEANQFNIALGQHPANTVEDWPDICLEKTESDLSLGGTMPTVWLRALQICQPLYILGRQTCQPSS
jgi:hypothetical protein